MVTNRGCAAQSASPARWPRNRGGAWGRLYPGIELLVGLGVLLQPESTEAAQLVGAVALRLGPGRW